MLKYFPPLSLSIMKPFHSPSSEVGLLLFFMCSLKAQTFYSHFPLIPTGLGLPWLYSVFSFFKIPSDLNRLENVTPTVSLNESWQQLLNNGNGCTKTNTMAQRRSSKYTVLSPSNSSIVVLLVSHTNDVLGPSAMLL